MLVDHGSKRAEANASLERFAAVYRYPSDCWFASGFFGVVNLAKISTCSGAAQSNLRPAARQDSAHGARPANDSRSDR